MTVETDHLPSTVSSTCEVDLLSSQVVQKWWVYMLLFLFPFQIERSSLDISIIIIIIMIKDTVSHRHAITYVNNSNDIFATQVR